MRYTKRMFLIDARTVDEHLKNLLKMHPGGSMNFGRLKIGFSIIRSNATISLKIWKLTTNNIVSGDVVVVTVPLMQRRRKE